MRISYTDESVTIQSSRLIDAEAHIVFIETSSKAMEYSSDSRLGEMTGGLYENLRVETCKKYDREIAFSVITITEKVRDYFPLIAKAMKEGDFNIPKENTHYLIVSTDIAKSLHSKPYSFLNVLIPKMGNEHPNLGISLPVKSRGNWTISVPSFMWSKVGKGVKDEGAGINLLGYIYRGIDVLMEGQTEGSIYNQMRAYHKGKFGDQVFVRTISEFKQMMRALKKAGIVSIDSEGHNLKRIENTIISLQFLCADGNTDKVDKSLTMWFLPLTHDDTPWTGKQLKYIKKSLRTYFESTARGQTHVYQNAKFDLHQLLSLLSLRFYGADIYDVSSGSFSLEEHQKILRSINVSAFSLENMEACMEYVRPKELVIGKADRGRMYTFSLEDIAEYGVIDVLTPYFIMLEQVRIAEKRGYPEFYKFVRLQIGKMLIAMTVMEHNGIPIDTEYLSGIASPMGSLASGIRDVARQITETKAASEANKILLKGTNFQTKGLFGDAKIPQLWSIRKSAHLQLMFFDVLGLIPPNQKDDGSGSLDAKFQRSYRHTPEVALFTQYQKLSKLKSAFADAIHEFMESHPDMSFDKRLRPIFTYLDVLTGRSSTIKPSSQQIPQHGKNAKIIKRQFCAPPKRLLGAADFSAHEVRVSGNLADDDNICSAVDEVNDALYTFRTAEDTMLDKALKNLKERGDLHVANYYVFFGVRISKDDPRRQDAKAAVFSVTYGAKSASVARKMLEEALVSAEDKLFSEPDMDPVEKKKLQRLVRHLRSDAGYEEYLEKSTELLKVLANKWGQLTVYIEELNENVRHNHVLFGPHGRPRHLWGYASPDKFVGYAMDRRGFNSMSQGYASDLGYVAMYLFYQAKWDLFESRDYPVDILQYNAVHDSAKSEMGFEFAPLYTYLQEHSMVTLAEKYYRKNFGIKTRSHYGFDLDLGPNEAEMVGWNKRPADLPKLMRDLGEKIGHDEKTIRRVVEDANTIGKLRLKELLSNSKGYRMTLAEDAVWERIVPKLNMFA